VPVGLPALTRAVKLSKRAAGVGFVWPSAKEVLEKLHEEVQELVAEVEAGDLEKARQEMGDVLFVVANLARTLEVDPEDALRFTNAKFARRFRYIEERLAERGKTPDQSDLTEMDALWDEAKVAEKG
jgi:tetrapyrrole methylase family protein/MazG family protein/ATP diphosphatase